jgi:hypothetical protein
MEGNINELQIINPPASAFEFIMGENRILTYKLHNTGEFPIKDFNVKATSILKLGDDIRQTKKNYVKVVKFPSVLNAGQKGELVIEAEVPFDYSEVIKRDGKDTLWPYRIALTIKSVKHITEL